MIESFEFQETLKGRLVQVPDKLYFKENNGFFRITYFFLCAILKHFSWKILLSDHLLPVKWLKLLGFFFLWILAYIISNYVFCCIASKIKSYVLSHYGFQFLVSNSFSVLLYYLVSFLHLLIFISLYVFHIVHLLLDNVGWHLTYLHHTYISFSLWTLHWNTTRHMQLTLCSWFCITLFWSLEYWK